MKLFVFFMSFIFIAGAIFGPVLMNHSGGHEQGVCGTVKAQGLASCFEFLSNFSAIIIGGGSLSLPILLSIFLIITAIIGRSYKLPAVNLILWLPRFLELFYFSSKNMIARWLALFENSPAFI